MNTVCLQKSAFWSLGTTISILGYQTTGWEESHYPDHTSYRANDSLTDRTDLNKDLHITAAQPCIENNGINYLNNLSVLSDARPTPLFHFDIVFKPSNNL